MSDNTAAPVPVRKSRTKLIVAVLSVLILMLIYGAGFIVLPVTIMSSFQGRNCDTVLSLYKAYTGLYPGFMEDRTLPISVNECQSYVTASSYEEAEDWRAAYDAYQAYSSTYPDGMFATQAHEHGALALMNLAREQIQGEEYKEALAGLERIVSDFADTDLSAEAWTMIPSTYISWGSGLRDEEQFEQAEQAFYRFKIWSQNNQTPDLEKDARRELAQLYIAWGLSIQSQKQYENALAKFDQALSADPQSEFASTGQAKAGKRMVYVEWGNELLEQDQVPEALEKFGNAVSLADGEEDSGARDALANGYLHWASDLRAEADFRGALAQLETAQGKAVTDSMNESVKAAFEETYLAFSTSSGSQAMRAMQDSFRTVCEQHTEPELPILGLNLDSVRIGIYGVEPGLFEKVAAKTPGEAHYLACVQEKEQTVDVDVENALYRLPDGYLVIPIDRRYRIKTIWTITVRESDTGEELATKVFEGGNPPPFPGKGAGTGNGIFKGTPPDINAILQWLQSVIQ